MKWAEIKSLIKEGRTLRFAGDRFGVSRERIRQIAQEHNFNIKEFKKHNPLPPTKIGHCIYCNKPFYRKPRRTNQNKFFCSLNCQSTFKKINFPLSKEKRLRQLCLRRHRSKTINGVQVPLYRIIAEKVLGRRLEKGEIVHHIDGNLLNDNASNLKVMTH